MEHSERGEFLDLLYDAALEPALWVPVMERFADMIGGNSACISQLNMFDGTGSVMIARVDPDMVPKYFEHYAQRNPLSNVEDPAGYLNNWTMRILTDEDWMPKDELIRTEYYNDFQAPQDVHSCLMIRLVRDASDVCVLNINRPRHRGQFERADLDLATRLHPHLVRAFRLSRRFAAIQQVKEGMAEALDRSAHGIFLIDETGQVRHANRVAEALVGDEGALRLADGRLTSSAPDTARRLHALVMSAACVDRERRTGGSMAAPAPGRRVPLSLTVAPLRSQRYEFLRDRLTAIVCVADPEAGARLPHKALGDLFGLTPAETRVAMALFEGRTSKDAADHLGLSFHTVRVHLARIFAKTQTSRQSDLLRLMMGAVGVEMD